MRFFLAVVFAIGMAFSASADNTTLSWGQIKRGVNIIPQKITLRTWGIVRIDPSAEVLPLIRQEVRQEKTVYSLLADLKKHGVEPILVSTVIGNMVVGFEGKVEFDTRVERPARYLLVYSRKGMTGEYRAWDKMLDENVPVGEVVWIAVLVGIQHFTPTIRLEEVKWKEL